ncbi:2-amino-4-hydroxy-6-hydroxymethyldihydropteridine diphosphokinase [Achromobacter agilis]|uniref:2-amino-4-hydroxy-6-hydroxymethyldihydropteridine pyrophosphokinase n=1 Tax=Achromobacter agilis TaxID=1353888 RepID=A0A446C807_9BURK|nr:2-amino-4-hydroxy-6-hydroxymethyldihydropteridine diphosphokinase [Achromobacter agilis]SSW64028.1 2-amino-4-hydroxy-6-hydroxymethyldihydropteridinepyrophosphokinase [Achromobacter agilis]
MPPASVRAYVGLGANLGDGAATLRQTLAELRDTDGILAVAASPFYRSAPVEATGPDFVNAVAAVDTRLSPLALLDALQALENRHGRLRPYKNAPRTLDLDLLLYGDIQMDHERLSLPHPRMHLRAFVLLPLRDLAPDLTLQGRRIDDWIGEIHGQDIHPSGV